MCVFICLFMTDCALPPHSLWACVCVGGATAHTWRSEDDLREAVLSFYLVSPESGAQVVRLGDKSCYLLSHLANPCIFNSAYIQFCLAQSIAT